MTAYRRKISGPLIDRFDLHVEVRRPPTELLKASEPDGPSSEAVRARVTAARERQVERQGRSNARLDGKALDQACDMSDACWQLLERAADKFNLSPRAHQRVRRVARTIADLVGCDAIVPAHVAEALSLRAMDRAARN